MAEWTVEKVQAWLAMPKTILGKVAPKTKVNIKHREIGFELLSDDREHRFDCFIREHQEFLERFSIGLVYVFPGGGGRLITRYNGNHGEHRNEPPDDTPFTGPHVHVFHPPYFALGLKDGMFATATDRFSTLAEAKAVFSVDCRITNWGEYFPGQMELPFQR